jgi:hypothetical protein
VHVQCKQLASIAAVVAASLELLRFSQQLIIAALRAIKRSLRYSGLGLDLDKIVVLSSRPPSEVVVGRLSRRFPGIKFVTKAKYLRLLMGPAITTTDILQAALDKFYERAQQLHPLVRNAFFNKLSLFLLTNYKQTKKAEM